MGLSSQGGHTALVATVVQRRAQNTCSKPICALTVGLVAAFKYEMLKLYLSVAILPVSSNVHDSHFFFSFVLCIVYFCKVIWCHSIHATLWLYCVLNFLCSSELTFPAWSTAQITLNTFLQCLARHSKTLNYCSLSWRLIMMWSLSLLNFICSTIFIHSSNFSIHYLGINKCLQVILFRSTRASS